MPEPAQNPEAHPADRPPGNVVCPFCALLCDDLSPPVNSPASLQTGDTGCHKARAGFALAAQTGRTRPMLQGAEVDWPMALQHTIRLLEASRLPLFHGLVGDLLDSRAALRLAASFGGVIDHVHGDAVARNLAVYQDSGWQVTSLGETRNRADLVVIVGDRLDERMPRLREKLFATEHRLHSSRRARILELSGQDLHTLDQTRILLAGRPLSSPGDSAIALHRLLNESDYPVFLLGSLDGPHAELIVRSCVGLVRDINETRRAALLPLGQGDGDVTAQLASAWHNGFGIRTSFARGYPEQDLQRFAGTHLIQQGEADLLIWISSLSAQAPPSSALPSIVMGHPAMQFSDKVPEVFLPVAIPGVHRAGFMHRGDGLRMLPLRATTGSKLPSTLELCRRLLPTTNEDT